MLLISDFEVPAAPRPIRSPIPTPGRPAYWEAQREAVRLVRDWEGIMAGEVDLRPELAALNRISGHGFASRMMAAHGRPVTLWIGQIERILDQEDQEEGWFDVGEE